MGTVEMRYKPERALTRIIKFDVCIIECFYVEMRYKPERALTQYVPVHSMYFPSGVK